MPSSTPRTGVLDPIGPGSLVAASSRYVAIAPCIDSCPLRVHDLATGASWEVPVPAGTCGWARTDGTIVGDRLLARLVGSEAPNWAAVDLNHRTVVPLGLAGPATLDPTGRWVLAASSTWLSALDLSTVRAGDEITRAVALRQLPLRERGQVVAIEGAGSMASSSVSRRWSG